MKGARVYPGLSRPPCRIKSRADRCELSRRHENRAGSAISDLRPGRSADTEPPIRQQLFLIVHQAATNALRHSEATKIEVEVQYLHDALRVVVRDNGCGINPEAFQRRSDLHRALCGMRDQAEKIGAQFGIWSKPGVGTEVCVAVPEIAKRSVDGRGP